MNKVYSRSFWSFRWLCLFRRGPTTPLRTNLRSADDEHQCDRAPERDQRDQLGPGVRRSPGAVAATITGQDSTGYLVQHYWVTTTGDTIKFDVAHLKPSAVTPPGTSAPAADLVAVRWGTT